MDLSLFNTLVNNWDDRTESITVKFANDIKLGRDTSTLEDRIRFQNDCKKAEKLLEMDKMKFRFIKRFKLLHFQTAIRYKWARTG